jgi:hypothetical protein
MSPTERPDFTTRHIAARSGELSYPRRDEKCHADAGAREHVRSRVWLIALALLAPVPFATASPMTGHLLGKGPISIGGDYSGSGRILSAFVRDSAVLDAFELSSPWVRVVRYDANYVDIMTPTGRIGTRIGMDQTTFEMHDVTLTLVPGATHGWLGMEPASEFASFDGNSASPWTPVTASTLGNDPRPDPDTSPRFHEETHEPTLEGQLASFGSSGSGRLKWSGPTLSVHSRENDSTWRSGETMGAAPLATRGLTWYTLGFDKATVALRASTPVAVELADVEIQKATSLAFTYDGGSMEGSRRSFAAVPGERLVLSGSIDAKLVPDANADRAGTRMDIAGEVAYSTLARLTRVHDERFPFLGVTLAVLASVAAGGVGLWIGHRRTRARARDPDDLRVLAELAADREDYAAAVRLIQEARRGAPGSVRLALDEASFHEHLGDIAAALTTFTDIAPRDPSGDADLHAARIMTEHRFDEERAGQHLIQTLVKSPGHVFVIEADPVFRPLVTTASVASAMRAARREIEERPS